jgi:hypothetical protein
MNPQAGKPRTSALDINVCCVEGIYENRCENVMSHPSQHGITHGILGYRNASGYWDQKQLREYHIQMHMGLYLLFDVMNQPVGSK